MNYCLFVSKDLVDTKYIDDCEELLINYNVADPTLPDFLQVHNNQKLIIKFKKEYYINEGAIVKAIKHLAGMRDTLQIKSMYLALELSYYNLYDEALDTYGFRPTFFFTDHANNIDDLMLLLQYKPCEIYICESLGFNLSQVFQILQGIGTKIRIYSNIMQNSSDWINKTANPADKIKGFFIRPEDVSFYSQFIDTIEFYGPVDRQKTLYEIYKKDGYWYGALSNLIIGYTGTLDNRCIPNDWGYIRSKCGRQCLIGGKCKFCDRIISLNNTMTDASVIFEPNKVLSQYEDKRALIPHETNN